LMTVELNRHGETLSFLSENLNAFQPQSVLKRGFIVATAADTGKVITHRSQVNKDQELHLAFQDGSVLCQVLENLTG
jgi:exonuclease VII large subunit